MIKKLLNLFANWKKERAYQKRVKQLKKRDPFIYK